MTGELEAAQPIELAERGVDHRVARHGRATARRFACLYDRLVLHVATVPSAGVTDQ
jgi:hypothetical protein